MNSYIEYSDFIEWDFPVNVFHNTNQGTGILVNAHLHDYVEILYVRRGKSIQQIEERRFPIVGGDIVVLKSNIIHGTISDNEDYSDIIVLSFQPELILATGSDFNKQLISDFINNVDFSNPIKSDSTLNIILKNLIVNIDQIYEDQTIVNRCLITADIIRFMGECVHSLPSKKILASQNPNGKRQALYSALNYMEKNTQRNITIHEISRVSGYSVSQFSRMIKSYTGMSFVDYFNNLRINKVCREINKGKSIASSAYENGFSTLSTFNRAFKKSKGLSPTKWLELMSIH